MAAKKKVKTSKKKVVKKVQGKKTAGAAAGTDPKRVAAILAGLDAAYPDATCELNYSNAFQLLIATILSAQCTDVRVNQVTQELFQKYTKPEDFAYASPAQLENAIRPTGFFRHKTTSIMSSSRHSCHGRCVRASRNTKSSACILEPRCESKHTTL